MHRFKELIKKNIWIKTTYRKISAWAFSVATMVSPVLNTKLRYRLTHGKRLDLNKPNSFHEKLLWLKLNCYMNDPLVIQCADKYLVREYVKKCGQAELLNTLLGAWNRIEDVPWCELPQKFALKWNFGAGYNLICTDKAALDEEQVIKQFNEWKKIKCWLSHSEMQYKYIPKKIICEAFLEDSTVKDLLDYKVYCFHGEPKAILVMQNRANGVKTEFFDTNWVKLENTNKYEEPESQTPKPLCLEKILTASSDLSKPFPFVRCDFYVVDDKPYFGELTFTPAGGMYAAETTIHGVNMAKLIHLPTDTVVA